MPRILCIDGGGIRGIIPAVVLTELEQRIGRPISACFDLIAGTSTGGIIALALTRPDPRGRPQYSAADLLGFYEQMGPSIFARDPIHRAATLDSLAGPRFDAEPLRRALHEFFGDTMLSESLCDVLVTSYDIERREPFFFKSHHARVRAERDFRMRDVAAATAAGPTYFEPVRLTTADRVGYRALVDGGVYANNPTMCAWVEAIDLYGGGASAAPALSPLPAGRATITATTNSAHLEAIVDESRAGPPRVTAAGTGSRARPADSDWLVVSLGTGHNDRGIPYAKARGWGLAKWATSIIDIVFDGVSDTVDYQMRMLLPETPGVPLRYCRIQTDLKGASGDLGDATRANIARLGKVGRELARANAARLDDIAARLT